MYVDEIISIASTQPLAKEATNQAENNIGFLGLQDATRKRRPIYQTPGEWTELITLSLEGVGLFVAVSNKKWNKAKYMIANFYCCFILLQTGLNFS